MLCEDFDGLFPAPIQEQVKEYHSMFNEQLSRALQREFVLVLAELQVNDKLRALNFLILKDKEVFEFKKDKRADEKQREKCELKSRLAVLDR